MPTDNPKWYAVFDPVSGQHVDTLDDNDTCSPYAGGDYNGHCGGCGMCLLMQASHYGYRIYKVNPEGFETDNDAVGRIASSMKTYFIPRKGKPDLKVSYAGTPPCLWCDAPVAEPSMDGPLVCGLCDSGLIRDADGTVRKWTDAEYRSRSRRRRVKLEAIIKTNDERGVSLA